MACVVMDVVSGDTLMFNLKRLLLSLFEFCVVC
jgi:hypothetical protein